NRPVCSREEFTYVPSRTLVRLQGNWTATRVVRDGQELPAFLCNTGYRTARENEIKVSFGGQVMIHALVRIDEAKDPIQIDYYNLSGSLSGTMQLGIMKWVDQEACFCMAAPGQSRPMDFESSVGSGRVVSQWRPAAQ